MGLVVSIGETDKSVIAEQSVDSGEVGFIAEMVTDPQRLATFDPGWSAKGAALATAAGDDTPEFPVIRVEEGWSRSGRLYDADFLESVAEQTNALEPVGHLGHIEDDKVATAFPDPQTTWFGAITRTEPSKQKDRIGEMVKTIYIAGYNLPGAKVRQYLKAKAVRGISWFGTGEQVPIPGKGAQVRNFRLLALDWARKLAEGMPTSSVVAIASEMEGSVADKSLATVSPEEFEKENPNGYALLVSKVEAKQADTIREMEEKVKDGEDAKSLLAEIRKALHIKEDADPLAAIADAMSKLGERAKATLDTALTKVLEEKVPDEKKRKLVLRMLPVAEMESKLADAKEEEAEKLISEMVDESFDKDKDIQVLIGEMQPPTPRRREEFKGGSSDNEYTAGRTRRVLA